VFYIKKFVLNYSDYLFSEMLGLSIIESYTAILSFPMVYNVKDLLALYRKHFLVKFKTQTYTW